MRRLTTLMPLAVVPALLLASSPPTRAGMASFVPETVRGRLVILRAEVIASDGRGGRDERTVLAVTADPGSARVAFARLCSCTSRMSASMVASIPSFTRG